MLSFYHVHVYNTPLKATPPSNKLYQPVSFLCFPLPSPAPCHVFDRTIQINDSKDSSKDIVVLLLSYIYSTLCSLCISQLSYLKNVYIYITFTMSTRFLWEPEFV